MKIRLLLILATVLAFTAAAALAEASNEKALSRENILHDPHIPAEGDSNGDLTIVEYFDYQCLYCKQVNSVLQ